MPIELRILSGARGGRRETFDKPVIAIGRHPASDLQFDPKADLDVSTRHAEIRAGDGGGDGGGAGYTIVDTGSTNGTFVNGRRIAGEQELRHGDVVSFGERGPRVEVHVPGTAEAARASGVATAPRSSTAERVAIAVKQETKGLKRMLAAAVLVLGAGVGLAYWLGHRESQKQIDELMTLLAEQESVSAQLQGTALKIRDTSLARGLEARTRELKAQIAGNDDGPSGNVEVLRQRIERDKAIQRGLAAMGFDEISERNDAAVAFLVSELDGKPFGGTAFGVTRDGLLVTNRHNLRSDRGQPPSRIAVKFANTATYLHAHLVTISTDKDVDLGLVQIDEKGTYPVVSGVSSTPASLRVGAPVVTIGFPHSLDLMMEGDTAKTSLQAGTVSKRLPSVVQMDSYAGHGSSGSPVFDEHGYVIGVVFGGPAEAQGRIVYAVPSDKVVGMLPAAAKAIVRP